mmetsp:Transcript_8550/g.16123  ORF Transcript_8550/g.16123 Transcript_8550/m.16123 type:complete len:113 (+) Transcript_8550:335-673(+)
MTRTQHLLREQLLPRFSASTQQVLKPIKADCNKLFQSKAAAVEGGGGRQEQQAKTVSATHAVTLACALPARGKQQVAEDISHFMRRVHSQSCESCCPTSLPVRSNLPRRLRF